jgi:hypothetical protein
MIDYHFNFDIKSPNAIFGCAHPDECACEVMFLTALQEKILKFQIMAICNLILQVSALICIFLVTDYSSYHFEE